MRSFPIAGLYSIEDTGAALPASVELLNSLEQEFGRPIPECLTNVLSQSDGMVGVLLKNGGETDGYFRFFSVAEILEGTTAYEVDV